MIIFNIFASLKMSVLRNFHYNCVSRPRYKHTMKTSNTGQQSKMFIVVAKKLSAIYLQQHFCDFEK